MYEIQAWFHSVDRDRSGSITANEIASSKDNPPTLHVCSITLSRELMPCNSSIYLVTFNGVPLGFDVATKLVKVFDRDGNRSIGILTLLSLH